ncbi:MAG: DUF5691 domain-containing protein [Steroidobacteraceae bacterium]
MDKTLSSWERLASIATLGSRRAPIPESLTWPDPSLAAANDKLSSELALLRLAAATRLWNEAGTRSSANERVDANELIAPPIAASNLLSEVAAWRLARMIAGEHREFIEEWFAHAAAAGRSLAPQWLPIVLDGVHRNIRDRYTSVLGPAATWLARHNPSWSVVPTVIEPSKERWLEGTLDERRGEFLAMRRIDPGRAIDWLQATWSEDPAEAREAFLKSMQTGLSMADEPFLENALDDRRKGVRQAAIELLAQLPDSRHAQRSHERAASFLVLDEQKGLLAKLRNRKLIVELPSAIDKAAQRDGIEPKPPAQRKIGERAFWLTQMVAFVRPTYWLERFNIDAQSFVGTVMATEFAEDLLAALTEAATRHPLPDLLDALSDAWLESKQDPTSMLQGIARLVAAADTSRRGALLISQARKLAARDANSMFYLLNSIDTEWTPEITAFAIEHITHRAGKDEQSWSHARNSLDAWGQRCDVATAAALLPQALASTGERSPWRNALEQLNEIVEFRAAMKRELM